jgi:dihydroorotase
MIVITGARVVTSDGLVAADIAIDGAVVSAVGTVDVAPGSRVIPADGWILGPGFVDLHVHFRDPGQTWKEDVESGSIAAASGGFTAVVMMPNTDPAIDDARSLARVQAASVQARIETVAAGAITRGRAGNEMSSLDELYDAGVRIFSDDGDTVANAGLLRDVMCYLSDREDVVIAQHGEDRGLAGGGHLHDGKVAARLGITGLPSSAEEVVLARDLILAAEHGTHYHAQHISSAGSVDIVRKAKAAGLQVTAEVTPHHLALTEEDAAGLDTNYKMYPPLRTGEDRYALREGLDEGVIDAIATDHAPHTAEEKDVPFEEAPRGVIGLETAFPVAMEALDGDVIKIFDRMSIRPARIGRLPRHGRSIEAGSPANLTLVDPSAGWLTGGFASRSANSPFLERKMTGKVMATVFEGALAFEGEL